MVSALSPAAISLPKAFSLLVWMACCCACSVLIVQHLHGGHEGTHAHHVVLRSAYFFGLVVHGVELSDLVTVADSFEKLLDAGPISRDLEV